MRILLLGLLLKAATVIVWGDAIVPHPQDLVLVGVGTGVVVAKLDATHYALVTAGHVAGYGDPHVAVYGHSRARPQVEMTIRDPRGEDVAVLIVHSRTKLPVVPIAQSAPRAGRLLTVVGHPYAQTWRITHARYEQGALAPMNILRPLMTRDTTLWVCRGCDRGNSGSGIFDGAGRLEGIVYAAAPVPGFRKADRRELRMDRYNPHIVRQVLAIDRSEVRSLLRLAAAAWKSSRREASHRALHRAPVIPPHGQGRCKNRSLRA